MLELVIVSMPNATKRREGMVAHLEQCPYPWRFQDAGPASGFIKYDSAQAIRNIGREINAAERGCFESHVRAIKAFVENGQSEFLIVCEDDIRIDFTFPFPEMLLSMKQAGVEYMRLYSRIMSPARNIQFWRNRRLIRFMWEPYGTQCYVLSKAGARTLLEYLSVIIRPIDNQIDRFWENGLPVYAIFPYPVIELQSSSGILRQPETIGRLDRFRLKTRRLIDRIKAVSSALRINEQDRAFKAALLRAGVS